MFRRTVYLGFVVSLLTLAGLTIAAIVVPPTEVAVGQVAPTPTPVPGTMMFEEFSGGIGAWWKSGNATAQQQSGNGVMRLTTPANGSVEASRDTPGLSLAPYQSVQLRVNLNGATLLGNDASALYLDQVGWRYVALSGYVAQGSTQWQTVTVPLSAFSGFNKNAGFSRLGLRLWASSVINVDVDDIRFLGAPTSTATTVPTATSTPVPAATNTPVPTATNTSATVPTPTLAPGTVTFEDFASGIGSWWTNGSVSVQQQGGNGVLRLAAPANGAAETSKNSPGLLLAPYQSVQLRVNLNGATLLGNDASALYLDQGGWRYVALSGYVTQGSTQWQTVTVPLSAFSGFDKNAGFSRLGFRFWSPTAINVDIDDIRFVGQPPTAVPTLTNTPAPTLTNTPTPVVQTVTPQAVGGVPVPMGVIFSDLTADPAGARWSKSDPSRVSMVQVGDRTVMRLSPPAQSAVEVSRESAGLALGTVDAVEVVLNLNGATIVCGDAGALYLAVDEWFYARLCEFVGQGSTQWQRVRVPLPSFKNHAETRVFDKASSVSRVGLRFWVQNSSQIDIASVSFIPSVSPTSTPTVAVATSTPTTPPTMAPAASTAAPPPLPNGNVIRCGPGWWFSSCGGNGEYGDGGNDTYWRGADGDRGTQWSSLERLNSFYQVNFQQPVTLAQVAIWGRGGGDGLSGRLEFSDGSTFDFGTLNPDGLRRAMSFTPRTTTYLRFKVTGMGNRGTSS